MHQLDVCMDTSNMGAPHEPTVISFTEQRAARLAGVSIRRLRDWDRKRIVSPSKVHSVGNRRVAYYEFDALIELLVAAALREKTSLQHMRQVLDRIRERSTDKPLRHYVFATIGTDIYFQDEDGTWEGGRQPGQSVIHQMIPLEAIRGEIRKSVIADRSTVAGRIERRRGVHSSRPVFASTRIPVSAVENYLSEGYADADILTAYPDLTAEDVATTRRALASA